MPDNLLDQELVLYSRIRESNHHDAQVKYQNTLLQKSKKKLLQNIPLTMWPEYLRIHIANFENLTRDQRNLLTAAIEREENYKFHFNLQQSIVSSITYDSACIQSLFP